MGMLDEVKKYGPTGILDIVNIASGGLIPTSIIGKILSQHDLKRSQDAVAIMQEEFRKQDVKIEESLEKFKEEIIVELHKYHLLSLEGVARHNLRIMAQILGVQIRDGNCDPALFNQYSSIISPLSYQEILLIATLYKKTVKYTDAETATLPQDNRDYSQNILEIDKDTRRELLKSGYFDGEIEADRLHNLLATFGACTRTGLIIQNQFVDGPVYSISPKMRMLGKKISFRDALVAEGLFAGSES